jgi:serine/threonine protein kinase
MTLVMKCLRPQIRASAEQFLIGVEDLIHETAMLASLDHPNIIKIHGRSGGSVSDSFELSDGYFILLDRLTDTLDNRIDRWKKSPLTAKKGPSVAQVKVATSLVDAILFLHQNHIVFRDLKPVSTRLLFCIFALL